MTTAAVEQPTMNEQSMEEQLRTQALAVSSSAGRVSITDQLSYDAACSFLTGTLKPIAKQIEEYFNPDIARAHALHKSLNAKKNALLEPIEDAEMKVKRLIGTWTAEQRRIQDEAQRKAAEEQRKRDEEAKLQTAIEAEERGATEEEKQVILDTPVFSPPPVAAPTFTKAQGVSVKTRWKAQCDNLQALCKAIGEGKVPINLVEVNQSALNKMASIQEKTFNVPGCTAYPEGNVAARAR
jgi:hypothetical protein